MRVGQLAERSRSLLPLAIEADVGEVAATEIEQREQVTPGVEIASQPLPGAVVLRCELIERRRPEISRVSR
jgi:hypothetical protein